MECDRVRLILRGEGTLEVGACYLEKARGDKSSMRH